MNNSIYIITGEKYINLDTNIDFYDFDINNPLKN